MASPKAPLLDATGKKSKDVTLDDGVFAAEIKPHLVHEVVRAEFAADRGGTRKVKTRGLVAGGRAKPWRQKGTGRARSGTIRAPHFEGGGVAFEPRTNFKVKVNKKVAKAALRASLASHAQEGTLAVLDPSGFTEPSTKAASALVAAWGAQLPLVLVANSDEDVIIKSFRNLGKALVTAPSDLEVSEVVWARSVLISEAALEEVTGRAS